MGWCLIAIECNGASPSEGWAPASAPIPWIRACKPTLAPLRQRHCPEISVCLNNLPRFLPMYSGDQNHPATPLFSSDGRPVINQSNISVQLLTERQSIMTRSSSPSSHRPAAQQSVQPPSSSTAVRPATVQRHSSSSSHRPAAQQSVQPPSSSPAVHPATVQQLSSPSSHRPAAQQSVQPPSSSPAVRPAAVQPPSSSPAVRPATVQQPSSPSSHRSAAQQSVQPPSSSRPGGRSSER